MSKPPLQLGRPARILVTVLEEPIRVDGLDFPAGTPMTFTYNFPFYRLSYLYDFFSRRDLEVAIGLTLQLRNTTIGFASQDGSLYRTNRNVGLVPALKRSGGRG